MPDATIDKVLGSVPRQLFIGGIWRPAAGGRTLAVENPATGEVIAEVADGSADDAHSALDAAVAAQPGWAATPPRDRGEILRRAYQLLTERTNDLALLMTLEMGKPVAESAAEITYAAEFFRWFAEEAVRIEGRFSVNPAGKGRLVVLRQPVGPCLLITPWNFPMAMGTRKIGPAVAAGCTMVLKPAQQTPLSSLALAELLTDAGLPPGVLNVVTTSNAGETTGPLLSDSRLRKLSFTGSTAVGQSLAAKAADQLLRISMELGGNAPFLVFGDADVDAAVSGAVIAKLRNGGEACTAANRFYVHHSVAAQFTEQLVARFADMPVGPGTDPATKIGPLIDGRQLQKVSELVEDALEKGARCLIGGAPPGGPGYFYPPTVLVDVAPDARLLREEIFGPVAPIVTFEDEDDAVAQANDTEFGLVSYLFTSSLERALRVSEALETGMVGLNQGLVSNPAAPFGGVKHSGYGREGGHEGINEYVEVKYLAVNL
ncbi:MAG: succinate-semialdehyde dehydrogenase / glutarate-semialdehyde dehydrogenase [Acidimicrobiaceae bacterium]|jgi:succinate-semialdehyde dehydrogenase/glutarate-semialdehyde dehydrogenase|nr:succinate-semialdehyde dehydrogenase / glutarate-semialdehyde dehydrogenase [Acidimicrobiaceae bacterium]MDQ1417801.1 succinate-semialdehyde dehydrogenase / glutarate-semialdehyde dehydrogenase [Acidimicrobiaceae bacterium]